MKKIISIFSVAFLGLLAGCDTTADLDGGVDQRVTAVINGYYETLAGAENGWIADVMTDEGSYRFHMAFTAGNDVTMYTDNVYFPELNGKPKTSSYNIRSLQRPVISFDTYNYIHIICDPDDGISGGSGNQGLNSDFEFEVDSLGQGDIFYLTGRKNRVEAQMRPATAEEVEKIKAGGLMNAIDNINNYHPEEFCNIMIGDMKVDVRFASRSVTLIWMDAADQVKMASGNIRMELNYDFEMFKPLEVEGKPVTGFVWDDATKTYNAVVDGSPVPVGVSSEAYVPLYEAIGENKTYRTMVSLLSMYPSVLASENYIGYTINQDSEHILAGLGMGSGVNQIEIEFTTEEEALEGEKDRMLLTVIFAGGYAATYTYYITYDTTDPSLFRVNKMTQENDGAGNAAFLTNNGLSTFPNFLVGKNLKLDWSTIKFGAYFMGQIEVVGGTTPAVYYGALLE